MSFLLDTCVFLWIIRGDENEISSETLEIYRNPDNQIFLSSISSWEITIKTNLEKLRFSESPSDRIPREMKATGVQPLPIYHSHALAVQELEQIHSDPFDRMLIAQAGEEELTILTPDQKIHRYDVQVVW